MICKSVIITLVVFISSSSYAKKNVEEKSTNNKSQIHKMEKDYNKKGEKHHAHKEDKHKTHKASLKKITKDKIIFKVNGMVCAFCAQGITKNFNKKEQVKETKVNLDKMEVTVFLKKGKTLSEDVIKKIVTDAGFAYVGMKK